MKFDRPVTYYHLRNISTDEFIEGMLSLGKPLEISLVGVFDTEGRGSRRDIHLPPHRDGEYSEKMVAAQGGTIVVKENIHILGLYCIREGKDECWTTVYNLDGKEIDRVNLKKGEALVLDNRTVLHGREGGVGSRILLRFWTEEV